MKLKFIGKFYGESRIDAEMIAKALSEKGFAAHHRPDEPKQVTVFRENTEEEE